MHNSEYILELRDVSKSFPGTKALDKVKLKLKRGSVHALVGENGAGKSTLMKCLQGIYHMDEGELYIRGKKVVPLLVRQMHEEGLSIIEQELSPVLMRSVMENIWLGREPVKGGFFIDHKKMYDDTNALMKRFGFDIDPKTIVSELSVAKIQMIEIIKAVSWGVDIVMMDEPTSALTNTEVAHLFRIIGELKEQGVSVIYVTHKMDELFRIADEVTVLRDGKWIASHDIKNVTIDMIVKEMVGRDIDESDIRALNNKTDEVVMSVKNLSDGKAFRKVSFELHRGEVLGLAGLVGAGRTEILETLFGLRKRETGTVRVLDREVHIKTPAQAMENGIVLLPEERRKDGIVGCLSIRDNVMVGNYNQFVNKIGLVSDRKSVKITNDYIKKLRIKTPDWTTTIEDLSGGNQQKVLIARWLLRNPEIFMLDEPTRGIDIGAKSEIYNIMSQLSADGKSMVVVSSELPELLKVCDRILVMSEGDLVAEFNREEATQEVIMKFASNKTK